MKFKSIFSAAALVIASLGGVTAANAVTVVDTITGQNSRFYCLGTGSSCGNTFGQSFTVGADTRLDSFSFWTGPVTGGSLDVVLRIFEWTGSARTGSELFASATTTLSNTDWATTSWTVGSVLNSGSQYMAYLDTVGLGNSTSQSSGFSRIGDNSYTGGSFRWERNTGDEIWNNTSGDSEFRASFSSPAPVPLPAALPLLLAALGGLGFMARRRKAA